MSLQDHGGGGARQGREVDVSRVNPYRFGHGYWSTSSAQVKALTDRNDLDYLPFQTPWTQNPGRIRPPVMLTTTVCRPILIANRDCYRRPSWQVRYGVMTLFRPLSLPGAMPHARPLTVPGVLTCVRCRLMHPQEPLRNTLRALITARTWVPSYFFHVLAVTWC